MRFMAGLRSQLTAVSTVRPKALLTVNVENLERFYGCSPSRIVTATRSSEAPRIVVAITDSTIECGAVITHDNENAPSVTFGEENAVAKSADRLPQNAGEIVANRTDENWVLPLCDQALIELERDTVSFTEVISAARLHDLIGYMRAEMRDKDKEVTAHPEKLTRAVAGPASSGPYVLLAYAPTSWSTQIGVEHFKKWPMTAVMKTRKRSRAHCRGLVQPGVSQDRVSPGMSYHEGVK